jgi:hypothetical protein
MRKNPALFLASLVVVATSGCSGEGSDSFKSQKLGRYRDATADEMCANGGVVFETGVDANKNGVLDDNEVSAEETMVVCEGDQIPDGDAIRREDPFPEGQNGCPDGGLAIHIGLDENGNDKLDDAEIDSTEIVCNSELPHAVLSRTTVVAVGSPDCRYGGQRIEAGIDDGAGDGKADDDVLADGEVDTSYLDCNANPPAPVDEITPPEGDPGTAVIDMPGGPALTGSTGGYGGTMSAENYDGEQCVPELTRIFPTGSVDASFEVPEIAIDLGSVPMEVTATGSLKTISDTLVEGDFFYDADAGAIRRWESGAPGAYATGMRVAANVTFVLPNGVYLGFPSDVEILGTIKNSANEVRSLNLAARNFVVGPSGRIEVLQQLGGGGLTISADALLAMQGKLSVNGETPGAAGGPVTLTAAGRIFLAGSIDASGSDSTSNGGPGGTVQVAARAGGLWSSASIDASGGDGDYVGGTGGTITLGVQNRFERTNATLDLRSSGALDVSGGSQLDCRDAICSGGVGGTIELIALGATLRSSGPLSANGGDSQGQAGNGGNVRLAVLTGRDQIRPSGVGLQVTGDITARGGAATENGGQGGQGGFLFYSNCAGPGSSADFLGYKSIELGGGAADPTGGASGGATAGGGGQFQLFANQQSSAARRLYLYVPISANGGDGYYGGQGGNLSVDLSTQVQAAALPAEIPSLVIDAVHHFDGGKSGQSGGGYGGGVSAHALGSVDIPGSFSASAISTESDGSISGGGIDLLSMLGSLSVEGDLHADGAEGLMYNGGDGGCIGLEGRTVTLAGDASAKGGNAKDGTNSPGGNGGTIAYVSHDAPAKVTGMRDVKGGTGTPAGTHGNEGPDLPGCSFRD